MFSSKAQLAKKTRSFDLGRYEYLQALVTEFQDSTDEEARLQVLANLGNFAYDPLNYEWLRKLHVLDLFLDTLTEENEKMREFCLAGICNLCLEPTNRAHLVANNAINLVVQQLSSSSEAIVMNAITILMFLTSNDTRRETTAPAIVEAMQTFAKAKNQRIKNLALVYLQDCCGQQREKTG